MAYPYTEVYNYLFNDLADPRVKNWTFMDSPVLPLSILIIYLTGVLKLPNLMQDKKPFLLKNTIFYYNILQILACLFLVNGIATSGWTTHYSFGCQTIDYTDDPMALKMLNYVYYTFILKMIELIETFFFILRKKYNQVSFLHVYHHSSTFLIAWIGCKYVGGGMTTFSIMINTMVHFLMYSYYLLTTLGPEWQKRLNKWKPKLTILQMVQFCIIIGHALQALQEDCHVPKGAVLIFLPNVVVIFYLFWQFYKNSYFKQQKMK